jgi:hypothetical protein
LAHLPEEPERILGGIDFGVSLLLETTKKFHQNRQQKMTG